MTSGVYKLEFPSGHYYYGKSDNIERRMEEHANKFRKNKHTTKMQKLYMQYGMPTANIVFQCHADHIDLIESMFIEAGAGEYSLNGNQPRKVSEIERELLINHAADLSMSTAEHLKTICSLGAEVEMLQLTIEELEEEGIILPDTLEEIISKRVYDEVAPVMARMTEQAIELEYYRNRTFWQRLEDLF